MKKTFLIPVDFTEVSEIAIAHAAEILKASEGKLLLYHFVKNSKELLAEKDRMNELRDRVQEDYPEIEVKMRIRIGDMIEGIGNAALENNAEMVVMGTHGLKGLQYITGSHVLKVVANCEVPVIIVQRETKLTGAYKNILLPMNTDEDSKQKLTYAKHLAKYFGAKIFLLAQDDKDEFLHNKIERDINFSKQYFEEADIEFEVGTVDADNVHLSQEYAINHDINLLVIMNKADAAYTFFDHTVQKIITNKAHIPVLLINPKSTSFVSIFGNYAGQG
jgi:nucleotide-binding universal stress UspA family protein